MTLGADNAYTISGIKDGYYNGLGLDIYGKTSYPFKRITPYIALGGGYAYFTQKELTSYNDLDMDSQGDAVFKVHYSKGNKSIFFKCRGGLYHSHTGFHRLYSFPNLQSCHKTVILSETEICNRVFRLYSTGNLSEFFIGVI